MKLRIRGDSLRLRLTQGEVQTLAEGGRVDETTSFGAARLVYALGLEHLPEGSHVAATLVSSSDEARVEVRLARAEGLAWALGTSVGFEGTHGKLRVLVEKDYACLKERPHEDDTDAFPNPNETC